MTLNRDPDKARAWQDRSRATAMERRKVPTDRRRQGQGIKPRSAKRERDMVERRKLVRALLAERPRCEARWLCDGAMAQDCHERLSRARAPGLLLDLEASHAIPVCRRCHTYLTDHPAGAERRRLLLPSWHACPPCGPC